MNLGFPKLGFKGKDINVLYNFRHRTKSNRKAARKFVESYDADLLGKVALAIFKHHKDVGICYALDCEAEEKFYDIVDKYNEQFNLKYTGTICHWHKNGINCLYLKYNKLMFHLSFEGWATLHLKTFSATAKEWTLVFVLRQPN